MKKILCLALLVLVFMATGICVAKVPDLAGKWTGLESWYGEVNGSAKLTENKSLNVTFVEPSLYGKSDLQVGEWDKD